MLEFFSWGEKKEKNCSEEDKKAVKFFFFHSCTGLKFLERHQTFNHGQIKNRKKWERFPFFLLLDFVFLLSVAGKKIREPPSSLRERKVMNCPSSQRIFFPVWGIGLGESLSSSSSYALSLGGSWQGKRGWKILEIFWGGEREKQEILRKHWCSFMGKQRVPHTPLSVCDHHI